MTKKGLVREKDFLDPISTDKPEGCWTLSQDPSSSVAILRSLAWPGYFFFHEVNGNDGQQVDQLPIFVVNTLPDRQTRYEFDTGR